MSRERDAIELIWKEIESVKSNWPKQVDWCNSYHARIEQILTQMEDLIQEDLTLMESSSRSREITKVCQLLEEYKKSQEATNTKTFWQGGIAFPVEIVSGDPAEGEGYSPI